MDKIQIHKQICEELNKTYEEKNKRYGDSFAKVRRELGDKVILVRLMDKLERLKTLLNNPNLENEENIEDTLKDLANYAIMELIERRMYRCLDLNKIGEARKITIKNEGWG